MGQESDVYDFNEVDFFSSEPLKIEEVFLLAELS
jgi:hypothetical protein